jgi:hypothetical protein
MESSLSFADDDDVTITGYSDYSAIVDSFLNSVDSKYSF